VIHIDLGVVSYIPLKGASYIPLPKRIKDKKAVLNIQNKDQKCFLWSILAAKHPIDRKEHPHRVTHYTNYEDELNMEGIDYPVRIPQIKKIEKQNENISINVFGFDQNELFPVYITKFKTNLHVNLLLYSNDDQTHYCLIRNMSRLLSSLTKHHSVRYHCDYCLHGFTTQDLLDKHEPICGRHRPQKIKLPDDDHNILSYTDVSKQLKVPFVIYADFESLIVDTDEPKPDNNISFTHKSQHHQPCGFSYTVVSTIDNYCKEPFVYRGEDAVNKFLTCLFEEEKQIIDIVNNIVPMEISEEEEEEFQNAVYCHLCNNELGSDRVRNHNHLSGKYLGSAHNSCNLNYKFKGKIPVIFHNLRGYDSHLIMQGAKEFKDKTVNCIANNTEKYISFSVDNLEFKDSLQFLNTSLEKLVENLSKEGRDKFQILQKYIDNDKVDLLLRKGVYPYEYLESFSTFDEVELPPIEQFYSSLTDSDISPSDYEHAKQVFDRFQCRHLGDYHNLYLKSDVLLLADVFENFRTICIQYYDLDPAHFYTSPGLSWQACLKMTGVELELFQDPDMYLFVEEGLRGGVSMISHRYAEANNPYLDNYNPNLENNYIIYFDANNLYGWAMSEYLPTSNFEWLSDQEASDLDVTTIADDSEIGYILEVDLEYPKEFHDSHNHYPLAAEKLTVSQDWLSSYTAQLAQDLGLNFTSTTKLIPNLNDKHHYVVHYRNLKQYLSLGLTLKHVHHVLRFTQSPWLKSYIDFNTEKRKHARNDFEKDFFKLLNNSVFGKTMENLRKRVNVKLISNEDKLKKLTVSPLFEYFKIFNEDLVAVNMRKPSLYLNRPIYVGFCILELSKTLMYNFHYNYIKRKYNNNATLLFTDTDSLCYDIKTDDVYQDMGNDLDLFDTSEYPQQHPLYSTQNKKVVGKFKDETHGIPIREFVGLRPKMYSILYHENGSEIQKKVAKGISKSVTKNKIRHAHYKDCLFNKTRTMNQMTQIRSFKHEVYTITLNKIGLSSYDDKRYILDDGITSVAYGHKSVTLSEEDRELVNILVSLVDNE